jgi:phenylpyruvate tautomerase PptA (4-oxalocrotonate tautomerase family)
METSSRAVISEISDDSVPKSHTDRYNPDRLREVSMPLTFISMRSGKSDAYKQAIFDGLYRAMRETFSVPEDDQFMTITEYDSVNFRYGPAYAGINRTDDVIFVQISAMNTRSVDQKKALYRRTVDILGDNPGVRAEDILINILEGARENWSLGRGLAQYA